MTHFGNGDEVDQTLVLDLANKFGSVDEITIIPGTNYGHVVLNTTEQAVALMNFVKQ